MEITEVNRMAWNEEVKRGNAWTRVVEKEEIERASCGAPSIRVTPEKSVPFSWIEKAKGKEVLLLGGGGGQQTPILASYGARVTTVDQAEGQLEQDEKALEQYRLEANLVRADMAKTGLSDQSFDYVISPESLNFIEDLNAVYKEVYRLLKKGGFFIFGLANPVMYLFDEKRMAKRLKVKYTLPYSAVRSLSEKEVEKKIEKKDTLEFSHTLNSIIGSLLQQGFVLEDFYSDASSFFVPDSYIHDCYLAFKARKV